MARGGQGRRGGLPSALTSSLGCGSAAGRPTNRFPPRGAALARRAVVHQSGWQITRRGGWASGTDGVPLLLSSAVSQYARRTHGLQAAAHSRWPLGASEHRRLTGRGSGLRAGGEAGAGVAARARRRHNRGNVPRAGTKMGGRTRPGASIRPAAAGAWRTWCWGGCCKPRGTCRGPTCVPRSRWRERGTAEQRRRPLRRERARRMPRNRLTRELTLPPLSETIRIMAEFDRIIDDHGGWRGASVTSKALAERSP